MKKITKNTMQQGDLKLRKLSKFPRGERKIIAKKRCILAHGESGHSHIVEDDEAELIQIGEQILLKIGNAVSIKHEEHNSPNSLLPEPELLEPGIWEIGRVREYDYLSKMVRPVQD